MKHLEMTLRDVILAAAESGAAALVTAITTKGSLDHAALVFAGIMALRAGLGVIANLKATPSA